MYKTNMGKCGHDVMKVLTGAFLWNERIRFTLRFIEQRTEQFKVNGVGCGTVTDMP
jgi:hypothetical protein